MNQATTLAALLRPDTPDDVIGQDHLLAPGMPLYAALHQGKPHSMLLWGPPGCGKTTVALLLGKQPGWQTIALSAVEASVKDIKAIGEQGDALASQGGRLLLFIDEIHRFNKAQQDSLLHMVEEGAVTLVGATTENPSFALNNALLSRLKVYVLNPIDKQALARLARRALKWRQKQQPQASCDDQALELAIAASDGDARRLLNTLELAFEAADAITREVMAQAVGTTWRMFDKQGDQFYDLISALHKSVRGSNPDATLYWLYRMLEAGCDPLYVARRMTRMASEDIGNADPRALEITLNAANAYERLGTPEGELALAQAALYLACTHKSNAVYLASKAARGAVTSQGSLPVPHHLRNAPTRLMKNLGYGKEYRYAHDYPDAYVPGERYLPDELSDWRCYTPTRRGVEAHFAERLTRLREADASSSAAAPARRKPDDKTDGH